MYDLIHSLKDPWENNCYFPILQKVKGSLLEGFSCMPTYE